MSINRFKRATLAFAFFLFSLTGCQLTLTPDHDAEMTERILDVAGHVDTFWMDLLATPVDARHYAAFSEDYRWIEGVLVNLHLRQQVRPLNDAAVRQAEIALELWQEVREQHQAEDSFSDFEAGMSREQFRRVFVAMARGEESRAKNGE